MFNNCSETFVVDQPKLLKRSNNYEDHLLSSYATC